MRFKTILFMSILFFLIIISILQLASAQPSYIYGPTGAVAAVDDNYTNYFITDGEGSVIRIVNESGDVIKAREYEPDGKNFFKYDASTPFDTTVPIGYAGMREDEDTGLYDESYDSGTGGYIDGTGVWLGLHWPTLGRELGSGAANLGLNIVTLGFYGHYKKWQMYQDYPQTIPKTWGEVGSQTLDAVPVVGSIKGAIESDSGLDRAGHISNAVGGAAGLLLWYKAYTAPEVAYVDPNGVTIMSKRGVPPQSAFTIGSGIARTGGGYITTFKTGSLERLYKNFARKGIPIRRSKYSIHLRYQDVCHWDPEHQILYLTDRPYYTEVLEELLHMRQSRRPDFKGFEKYKIDTRGWQYYDELLDTYGRSARRIFPPHEVEVLKWLRKSKFIDPKDRQTIEHSLDRCKEWGLIKE